MKFVEDICTAPTVADAWDFIRTHHDKFFWTDSENHVEAWNVFCAAASLGHPMSEEWRDGVQWLSYRGVTAPTLLRFNREDRLLVIHSIAQLVRADCEFRFCQDSGHSSDQAFLAIPAAQWSVLESELGSETVARHFLRLDPNFDVFLAEYDAPSDESPGQLDPAMTNWIGGPSYQPAKLNYVVVSEDDVHVNHKKLETLLDQYLVTGQIGVSIDASEQTYWEDRGWLLENSDKLVGFHEVRVVDSTNQGFLIIERNGVAAGWRTDDRDLLSENKPATRGRGWKFWKTL